MVHSLRRVLSGSLGTGYLYGVTQRPALMSARLWSGGQKVLLFAARGAIERSTPGLSIPGNCVYAVMARIDGALSVPVWESTKQTYVQQRNCYRCRT